MQIREPVRIYHDEIYVADGTPQVRWWVCRLANLATIAEGSGTSELEAQQNLRASLVNYGLTDEEVTELMHDEEGWIL